MFAKQTRYEKRNALLAKSRPLAYASGIRRKRRVLMTDNFYLYETARPPTQATAYTADYIFGILTIKNIIIQKVYWAGLGLDNLLSMLD